VIARTRESIASRFRAGDSVAELAHDYEQPTEAIEAAIRQERLALNELLLEAWSCAADLQQHGRYTSSEIDALELREKIEVLGIVPEEWIKQAEENVNRG
jgi:hypothetical protein